MKLASGAILRASATARADFPVPGGPCSSTPRGGCSPSARYRSGRSNASSTHARSRACPAARRPPVSPPAGAVARPDWYRKTARGQGRRLGLVEACKGIPLAPAERGARPRAPEHRRGAHDAQRVQQRTSRHRRCRRRRAAARALRVLLALPQRPAERLR
jgi:hypothetical protein